MVLTGTHDQTLFRVSLIPSSPFFVKAHKRVEDFLFPVIKIQRQGEFHLFGAVVNIPPVTRNVIIKNCRDKRPIVFLLVFEP
jgi:hypothetical protein